MNNDETMIMQPQQVGASEQNTVNNASEAKNAKTGSTAQRVMATAAGAFGGAMGAAASTVAGNMLKAEEMEAQTEETAPVAEPSQEAVSEPTPAPAVEAKEEVPVAGNEGGIDYTGHEGADPVVATPQPTGADEGDTEVRVLGIYGNDEGQELAVLTDGETVAAVFDANGDGMANVIAVDEDHNNQFDEGEIYDISDQHIGMNQFEDAYIAQQQEEQVSQETFAYNASDETDYNNDAEVYDA